jgi:hypothetical protein
MPPLAPIKNTLPSASGRDPWFTLLQAEPTRPAADPNFLAFGTGNLTQDPRYRSANLPPYNESR